MKMRGSSLPGCLTIRMGRRHRRPVTCRAWPVTLLDRLSTWSISERPRTPCRYLNLETMRIAPDLVLSDRHEIRLALCWLAQLRDQVQLSLAATGGVHFAEDVIKALLVNADAVLVAAAMIRYGPRWINTTLSELTQWLESKDYLGVAQLKGSMRLSKCPDPAAFHRVNYVKSLISYTGNQP